MWMQWRVIVCRARARARAGHCGSVLVPQHVRGGGGEHGALAVQVMREGGVEPLAPLPLAHRAALAVPVLPRNLQPYRHVALALAPQARRPAAQTLNVTRVPHATPCHPAPTCTNTLHVFIIIPYIQKKFFSFTYFYAFIDLN